MKKCRLPLYADFLITPFCNLECSFCSAAATKNKLSKIKVLTLDEIDNIFNQLDELEVLKISLEGGEPFCRDDIIEIMHLADKHDFNYYINTNGTLIDEKKAKEISKTNVDKICISIDGPNAEVHDRSRGVKGTFKKVNNAIKYLKKYGVAIDGIITLSKINKDYIIETLEYLKSLEIYNVAIMLLASVGNADDNYDNTYLSFDELCEVIKELTLMKVEGKMPVSLDIVSTGESLCPWEIYLPLKHLGMEKYITEWKSEKFDTTLEDDEFGCTAGKDSLCIDGYGNVFGCSLMVSMHELIAGNTKRESLVDIWNNSHIFNEMRRNKLCSVEGPCSNCNLLHSCKSGCRACAYARTKKLNGSDMRCPLSNS